MSKASGYSLWFVPDVESDVHRKLSGCIEEIAKSYRTPNFVPHVTLLGGVCGREKDIRAKTENLASFLIPYEIDLGEIGSNGTYFQILFLKVRPSSLD